MIHCCFAPFGSHRSHRSHWIFLLMVLNLTDDSGVVLCSHRSHRSHWIFLLMVLNLTEVGRWVVERVWVLWVLRVLRFPKTHTNYFCWISLNLCEPKGAKVRRASVRFNARRAKLWDLWDLCEPKGARVREASVRFSVRRAKLWDLRDLCEA